MLGRLTPTSGYIGDQPGDDPLHHTPRESGRPLDQLPHRGRLARAFARLRHRKRRRSS
jgi:hypothetical protein